MRGILIIWSMLVFSAISMAQNPTYYLNPGKKLNQYNITTLTTDNGLPSNSLLHIYQAKNGYIWISGYSGLVRYNGTDFQVFNNLNTDNLESNVFRNIAEDSEGTLWMTTQGNGLVSVKNPEFK